MKPYGLRNKGEIELIEYRRNHDLDNSSCYVCLLSKLESKLFEGFL